MNSFYTVEELLKIGFKSIGDNVYISRKASIYSAEKIKIGNNVRIDDFCILSGNIFIGNYVHISAGCYLYGGDSGIVIDDYCSISSRSCIYAISDDYSGNFLVNPMVREEYRNVIDKQVLIEKYVVIGSGCTVLPGVTIKEGSAFGSMSFINRNIDPWGIYIGIPCRKIKDRSKRMLDMNK